jgi:hypothetical protein
VTHSRGDVDIVDQRRVSLVLRLRPKRVQVQKPETRGVRPTRSPHDLEYVSCTAA